MKDPDPTRGQRSVSRRDFLRLGAAAGTAVALGACSPTPNPGDQRIPTPVPPPVGTLHPTAATAPRSQPALRIAHITDMHMQSSGPAKDGLTRALRSLHARTPAVDFVLNTGDCVMDSLNADKAQTEEQWEVFTSIMKAECKLPVFHAIGNHDVWGWGLPAGSRGKVKADPLFGKGMAVAQLAISDRYYSFDQAGWRFLVLDSTHLPEGEVTYPYSGKLDDEQYDWLAQQLESTPATMPVCIASHIPVLAACEFLDGDNETTGNWVVPGAWVHIDARRLWKLFGQHPNVRLCLSGHTHQVEDLRYHGAQYLTNGAICGNWWNGSYFDFPPGYVVVSLYQDGFADSEFVAY